MPYTIARVGEKFQVKKTTGEAVGKPHDTKEDAQKHLAALEANVEDATPQEGTRKRTGYFAELTDLCEAELSADGSVARVTLIRPGWSQNGRYYAPEVLARARGLFEGGQAYADHPSRAERKDRPERSVRDLVGYYEDVRQEQDGRLTANFHVVQEWLRPIVSASVKENARLAGLSINALGETRQGEIGGKRGIIVENIAKHNSTDVVTTPAAGGKFESLLASDGDAFTRDLLEAMPLDELMDTLRDARPDLVKAWQKEWKTPRDTEAVSAARAQLAEAKAKVVTLEKEIRTKSETLKAKDTHIARLGRELMVDRLLNESTLPKEWKTDIRSQLIEAADIKAMEAILEREARKAAATPRPLKISGVGAGTAAQTRGVSIPRSAPIADIFGVNPVLSEAKSYEEYTAAKKRLMEA